MSADLTRRFRRYSALSFVVALSACSWFTDFKQQPKFDPWESTSDTIPARANPQFSVPVYGSAVPGYAVSRQRLPGTIDSMKAIQNPVPADARSLANGHKYYAINCAVCHGYGGRGDGAATKYGMPGMSIATPGSNALSFSDGYIWGMMRNGRGLMPSYNRIEELDRWDVVNYIRGLQGRYQVATGPVGLPGETGDKVPGPSQTGPTRPSPYYHHAGSQAGPEMPFPPGAATAPATVGDSTAAAPSGAAPPPAPTTTTPKTGGER